MTYHPAAAAFDAAQPADNQPAPQPADTRPSLYEQWRAVSDRIDAEDAAKAAERAAAAVPATCLAPSTDAAGRTLRHDGWIPDRQRAFLAAIADGETVERAARRVGLSVASAYALRQRAAGAPFALGWRAANLLGRDVIADRMFARAMDGQVETVTRPDGSVVSRHRYDNRTAMTLLARLDRLANEAPADPAAAAQVQAARLVAQDFEAYLDLLEVDRGPAAAGLFLARRTGAVGQDAALDPVLALARADRFVRSGAGLADEVDTADLDPARRADWTAGQWQRAEAAGLLRLAPAPAETPAPQHPQLVPDPPRGPVWWDEEAEAYRTSFPPPADELPAYESEDYGGEDYERSLTDDEQALLDAAEAADIADKRDIESDARDAWFAALEAEIAGATAVAGGDTATASSSVTGGPDRRADAPPFALGAVEPA